MEWFALLFRQFLRYGAVGVVSNLVLYLLFVVLNALGLSPIWAMTSSFAAGCCLTYFAHGRYSFRYGATKPILVVKYAFVYGSAYALNLVGLWVGTTRLGLSPRLAQIAMMVLIGVYLFLSARFFVFRTPSSPAPAPGADP
ncbi:MAG: GtrA family protein [Byssovorax sp.]